jgi:hypothetical protein
MATNGADYGEDFCLTLLANDPHLAEQSDQAGIDRIGIDVERVGKQERQPDMDNRDAPRSRPSNAPRSLLLQEGRDLRSRADVRAPSGWSTQRAATP